MTSTVFWTKLESPISVTVPCYPLPASAQEVLHAHLKAVPAEVVKQTPAVAMLVEDLANVFDLGQVTSGALTPSGGTRLRELLAPSELGATVATVRSRLEAIWKDMTHVRTSSSFVVIAAFASHVQTSAVSSRSTYLCFCFPWQLDDTYFLLPQAPPPKTNSSVPASPCRHTTHASPAASPGGSAARHAGLLTPLRGSNPLGSRAPAQVPQTPMTSQLESVGWLSKAIPDAPTAGLDRFFNACDPSPRADIEARLSRLSTKMRNVLDENCVPSRSTEEQIELGTGLYYKMLLSFLEAEEKRLKVATFSALLANDAFHTSLLACCLEAVFASYSTAGMAFPAILTNLNLQPFDFGKVIESFIKHEPRLPAHLKMHFADVESKIIETLAWMDDSPLHALMAEYDVALQSVSGAAAADGQTPQPGPSRAKAALEQFVRKCLYLAAKRIQDICLRLLLPSTLTQQVWEVAKLVLDTERSLLKGRHLDQIIMCSVYGVCKVNKRQVTFRHIIEQYRRQPGASPMTFRNVRMHLASEEPQDIIQFYNSIFIPAMKEHLMRVCSSPSAVSQPTGVVGSVCAANPASGIAGSSRGASPDINAARGKASPRHVSGSRDFYVSSRTGTHGPNPSPRTHTLYAFPDPPRGIHRHTDGLRAINANLAAPAGTDIAADALHRMSSDVSAAAHAAAVNGMNSNGDDSRRAAFDLHGEGSIMASGHKRSRTIFEPSPSQPRSSSAGSSDDPPPSSADR